MIGAQQSYTILLALTKQSGQNHRGRNRLGRHTILILAFNPGTMACGEAETQGFVYCTCRLFHSLLTSEMLLTDSEKKYGCNPTGMTATLQRRKEVLQLAREHNFIILEGAFYLFFFRLKLVNLTVITDDPYFYLYYGQAPRYPSYFELELQEPEVGRVLRFDSLSKILSAGMRIGFASGPEPLLNAIDGHVRYILGHHSLKTKISYR